MTISLRPAQTSTATKLALWPMLTLGFVAVDLLALYAYLGRRIDLLSPVWIYLCLYVAAFGLYVYAAGRLIPLLSHLRAHALVPVILSLGIVFRLCVLSAPPSLSTDIYRYIWDGRLACHGVNPYRWPPNDVPARTLRDSVWEHLEYRNYQTIYMPTSQAAFALGALLFGTDVLGFKAIYTLFDVGIMLLLLRLLRARGQPTTLIVWYAWCPLPIIEVSLAGHQDVVGVFFLLLTFVLTERRKTKDWAAVTLVAAALTKGFALLLLPLFCRTFGRRFTAIAVVSLLVFGLPLWICLPEFLRGMQQYLRFVHVNAGLYQALNWLLTPLTGAHSLLAMRFGDAVIVAVTLWAAHRPARDPADLRLRSFLILAVTLLVVPTLFPWYLLWILPFMVILGHRPSWAFVLLTGTIALIYTYYISILTFWWTPLIEYLPFVAVLAWEMQAWKKTARRRKIGTWTDWLRRPELLSGGREIGPSEG